METCPRTETADFLGKDLGSENACTSNFRISEIQEIPKESKRHAPRVGLRGGKGKSYRIVDLFWARVQKNPDPAGCWLFAGAVCNRAGHKHVGAGSHRVYAHRFSYQLHHGRIPRGAVVMHTCDVPSCVNPAHLRVGSQRENVHDAIGKGRFSPWTHPNTVAAKQGRRKHVPTVARGESVHKMQTLSRKARLRSLEAK